MRRECHCEGAAGDCGNLNLYNMKNVYFRRRPQNADVAISGLRTIEIASLRPKWHGAQPYIQKDVTGYNDKLTLMRCRKS